MIKRIIKNFFGIHDIDIGDRFILDQRSDNWIKESSSPVIIEIIDMRHDKSDVKFKYVLPDGNLSTMSHIRTTSSVFEYYNKIDETVAEGSTNG